jgi:hypothetical protein
METKSGRRFPIQINFVIVVSAIISFFLPAISAPGSTSTTGPVYPRLETGKLPAVAGDTVSLWLVKGVNPDACVPGYTVSYKIETSPIEIYPPIRFVFLSYTEVRPPKDMVCILVETEYGPRYVLPNVEIGNYTVIDGDKTAGSFSVTVPVTETENHSVSGKVTNDPYPSKMMSTPVKGVRVYLLEQLFTTQENISSDAPIMPPYAGIIDSAVTGEDGKFIFSEVPSGTWNIRCTADKYVTRTIDINLFSDTSMVIAMLDEGASSSVSGYVSRRHDNPEMSSVIPVAGCTVMVITESEYGGGNYLESIKSKTSIPAALPVYTAITDKTGFYSIDTIPIVHNAAPAVVYTRAEGLTPESRQIALYNTMSVTVSFDLQKGFSNRDSVVIDGVAYIIATEKERYMRDEFLSVAYYVENRTNKTVTFQGNGPGQNLCTYALIITDGKGAQVFSTNDGLVCPLIIRQWELAPGGKDSIIFDPYLLDGDYQSLTVSGMMNMDEKTKVSIDIDVLGEETEISRTAGGSEAENLLTANRNGNISVCLSARQEITIAAYQPDGRLIDVIANHELLAKGWHAFSIGRNRLKNGMVILRATGESCSLTKRIFIVR